MGSTTHLGPDRAPDVDPTTIRRQGWRRAAVLEGLRDQRGRPVRCDAVPGAGPGERVAPGRGLRGARADGRARGHAARQRPGAALQPGPGGPGHPGDEGRADQQQRQGTGRPGGRAPPHRPGAPRRGRPAPDRGAARPQAGRAACARRHRRRARAAAGGDPRRARRRTTGGAPAASGCARGPRPHECARVADQRLRPAQRRIGTPGRRSGAADALGRGRARRLPGRPGGADQRGPPRKGRLRHPVAHAGRRLRRARGGRRRAGLRHRPRRCRTAWDAGAGQPGRGRLSVTSSPRGTTVRLAVPVVPA